MTWLDLSIFPHQETSQEEANMFDPIEIKLNHGYVKKKIQIKLILK